MHMTLRRQLLAATAVSIFFATAGGGPARAADRTYQFDIPAESLSRALTDYSQASSQQIFFTEDVVKDRKSDGLHGRFTLAEALKRLLSGTDLSVETNSAGVMMVRSKNAEAASNEGVALDSIETITVTGTQIRGVVPITPVLSLTHDDMIASGYTRLDQALEQLPQNFKGGASQESNPTSAVGENASYNSSYTSGVNLLGLGPNSTLVLLNGHRLPEGSYGDSSADLSKIPLSAIDRVEILTDGASTPTCSRSSGLDDISRPLSPMLDI